MFYFILEDILAYPRFKTKAIRAHITSFGFTFRKGLSTFDIHRESVSNIPRRSYLGGTSLNLFPNSILTYLFFFSAYC